MARGHARRLIVINILLELDGRKDGNLDKVNVVVNCWTDDPLDAVGSASWRGETVAVEQASCPSRPSGV